MKIKLLLAALMLFATSAYASTDELKKHLSFSNVQTFISGMAKPGDTIRSRSDPNVVFQVLPSGTVLKINKKYGTEYRWHPEQETALNKRKTLYGH